MKRRSNNKFQRWMRKEKKSRPNRMNSKPSNKKKKMMKLLTKISRRMENNSKSIFTLKKRLFKNSLIIKK